MPFPANRFRRLAPEIIERAQAFYERLTPAEQTGFEDQIAGLSDDAITERFPAELVEETEPEEPEPEKDEEPGPTIDEE